MQSISRRQAKDLLDNRDDLIVVETLSEQHYRTFHLPGAYNVPLDDSFAENIAEVAPDPSAPILVYCLDAECDASSKAAKTLEELGYTAVYDYEAGKVDWKVAGLPIEEPASTNS